MKRDTQHNGTRYSVVMLSAICAMCVANKLLMLYVVMLSVVMVNVAAPF
jgi:hypothetical protein